MIETLSDVIEEICDALGVYGAHDSDCDHDGRLRGMCRVCAAVYLHNRIMKAAEVDKLMRGRIVT